MEWIWIWHTRRIGLSLALTMGRLAGARIGLAALSLTLCLFSLDDVMMMMMMMTMNNHNHDHGGDDGDDDDDDDDYNDDDGGGDDDNRLYGDDHDR